MANSQKVLEGTDSCATSLSHYPPSFLALPPTVIFTLFLKHLFCNHFRFDRKLADIAGSFPALGTRASGCPQLTIKTGGSAGAPYCSLNCSLFWVLPLLFLSLFRDPSQDPTLHFIVASPRSPVSVILTLKSAARGSADAPPLPRLRFSGDWNEEARVVQEDPTGVLFSGRPVGVRDVRLSDG